MTRLLPLLLLAAASVSAFAARPTIGSQPFPDDYTPHPCAPAAACASLSKAEVVRVGAAMRGYSLKQDWVDRHFEEMVELLKPACAKLATCYATPGNQSLFCMDLLFPAFWGLCDRYPKDSEMFEQCSMFMRIYSLRADLQDKETWKQAQACAAEKTPRTGTRPMKVWISPETIGDGYDGKFTVYALDPETKVPIQALVSMNDGSRLSARAPGGKPWTNYEIKWPVKFTRVTNAAGHIDLVPPSITVTADGYEPATLTLPAQPRKVIVEMTPAADKLKRGRNSVTVTARDAATGKPVELRVMLGETILGDTNEPLEIEIRKGEKRPEIWATSLFNLYNDVVVAPAEK
jgi:hypothetical protein